MVSRFNTASTTLFTRVHHSFSHLEPSKTKTHQQRQSIYFYRFISLLVPLSTVQSSGRGRGPVRFVRFCDPCLLLINHRYRSVNALCAIVASISVTIAIIFFSGVSLSFNSLCSLVLSYSTPRFLYWSVHRVLITLRFFFAILSLDSIL